jgi:low molecular weight phosphotyrosine protein phosphatase
MDRQNLRDLKRLESRAKNAKAKVMLFGEWAGKEGEGRTAEEVDDPYYGGRNGFEKAYEQCVRFSGNFLEGMFLGFKA